MVSNSEEPRPPVPSFPSRAEATRQRLQRQAGANSSEPTSPAPSAPAQPEPEVHEVEETQLDLPAQPAAASSPRMGAGATASPSPEAPAHTQAGTSPEPASHDDTALLATGDGQATPGAVPTRKSVIRRQGTSFDDILQSSDEGEQPPVAKEKEKKPKSWLKRISLGIVYAFLLLGVIGVSVFTYLYVTIDVPEADEVALAQTTTVYYADGTTRMGTYSEVNRTIIDTKEVPAYVGHAIVSSEDRTFYTNSGVDLRGIMRALYTNLTTGSRQGGSTLTQQYVERYYVGETTSYGGKLKEAVLAIKINRQQTKDQILGNYMNTIYFGRGAYGIEAAAKLYFGKHARELTLSEAAMLAGIIPAPSAWDPALDLEQAQKRWKRVLDLMVEDGWVSAAEAKAQTFPQTLPLDEVGSQDFAGPQGYLLAHIRQELKASGNFTDEQIETGGLKIVSTIDKPTFDAMVEAANTMNNVEGWKPDAMHVAISSIDPATGEIVAEYGGPDYLKRQQNAATQDIAPAGSTFKVFTLLAHVKNGGSVYDVVSGSSPQYFDGLNAPVSNDGDYSYGMVDLVRATEYSINTAFVAINEKVGADATYRAAIDAGIPEDTLGLDDTLLNTLGFAAPRNIDLATSYATLASGGEKRRPHIVREVSDGAGNVLYRPVNEAERVFSAQEVSDILPAMEAVVGPQGTADRVRRLGLIAAGKTGTSSDQMSAQFVAFTPKLSTAVSMYQSDENGNPVPLENIGGINQFHGGDWPVDVWIAFMEKAGESAKGVDFAWRLKPSVKQPVYSGAQSVPATQNPEDSPESALAPVAESTEPGSPDETREAEGAQSTGGYRTGEVPESELPEGSAGNGAPEPQPDRQGGNPAPAPPAP